MIMGILDLFSKRQQRIRGEVPDIFIYDDLPAALRVQIIHVLKDALGNEQEFNDRYLRVKAAYEYIVNSLSREYGLFRLTNGKAYDDGNQAVELFNFILNEPNIERVLDAVELSFKMINVISRDFDFRHHRDASEEADAAIVELNTRFQYHGIGYRFEAGEIFRIDSEVMHSEVVKPALTLLHDAKFKGAEAEFHLAHEHYRHGRSKEALAECLKSIESTVKAIAKARKWNHDPNATIKPLLDLMFEKQLIPQLWAQHFSGLRAMLESGVPTVRNRLGGHGQGAEVVRVPGHYVAFALHQTAAAIVFLATAESEQP